MEGLISITNRPWEICPQITQINIEKHQQMVMYNITLIGTRHREDDFCTSNELYKIFEVISPDVIFEEMPPSYFDKYYVTKVRKNLESDAVLKYLENHNIQHIPVDSDDIPSDAFFKDLEYMYNRIEKLTEINGFNYRKFSDMSSMYIRKYGLLYANSDDSITIQNKIQDSMEKGLQVINDEKLYQTYQKWLKINEKRENEMLQNIYNYSKENTFSNAIFMIGFAHRKSIMQKITEFEDKSEIKINWTFAQPEWLKSL